jgi:hypothetical protein
VLGGSGGVMSESSRGHVMVPNTALEGLSTHYRL